MIPTDVPPPDWIQEVRRKYWFRVSDWVTQSWAVTCSPRRFMEEWATRRREALNPLRFFAVGITISFLTDRFARKAMHIAPPPDSGWQGWLNGYWGYLGFALAIPALMHVILRTRSHAPLRSTLAASLYSYAGPNVILTVVGWMISGAWFRASGRVPLVDAGGTPWPLPVIVLAYASTGWSMATQAGVHRVRWWWPAIALAIVVVGAMATFVGAIVAWNVFHR